MCRIQVADVINPSVPSFCTPGNPPRYLLETSLPSPFLRNDAKPQTGSSDCGFGDIAYFRNFLRKYNIPFDLNARLDQLRLEGACI